MIQVVRLRKCRLDIIQHTVCYHIDLQSPQKNLKDYRMYYIGTLWNITEALDRCTVNVTQTTITKVDKTNAHLLSD